MPSMPLYQGAGCQAPCRAEEKMLHLVSMGAEHVATLHCAYVCYVE